jgi:HEAT repeat protein
VPEAVFFLLDDASEPVRQAALSYLASRRSEVAENLLVNYLKNGNGPRKDKEHIFSCFRALGRCGSDRSISFLRRNLLEGSPLSKFMRSTERQAAALALRALHTEEARRLLEEAARSLFPGVRRAVRMPLEDGVNP